MDNYLPHLRIISPQILGLTAVSGNPLLPGLSSGVRLPLHIATVHDNERDMEIMSLLIK